MLMWEWVFFNDYILLRTTTVVVDVNTFQYVLSRQIVGGKFNKWIVILQEFDLDFQYAKSKKSLFFTELIVEFPVEEDVAIEEDSFPDEYIFLISTSDPWYGDILIYLQNLKYPATFSGEERRKHVCIPRTTSLLEILCIIAG